MIKKSMEKISMKYHNIFLNMNKAITFIIFGNNADKIQLDTTLARVSDL